jgi:hypothetical protein
MIVCALSVCGARTSQGTMHVEASVTLIRTGVQIPPPPPGFDRSVAKGEACHGVVFRALREIRSRANHSTLRTTPGQARWHTPTYIFCKASMIPASTTLD